MPNVITEKKLQLSAFIDFVLDLGWNCMIQNAVSGYLFRGHGFEDSGGPDGSNSMGQKC